MNGFDRVVGEESCFHGHCSLPPTPQEYYAGLWSEVNALKEPISMPAEDTVNRPRQKNSLDKLLANFEFARIKEYVAKWSREAVQVQVTVTQVNTVQHSSPCPLDPELPSDACVNLENNEGRMDPELDELISSSTGTGFKTPGQQCPPNEGIWETGRTTAPGILTAGAGPSQGEDISSPTERVKNTRITADTTCLQQGHKTFSEQNKQFDLGGRRTKAPLWNAAVALLFLSAESWKASCLCFVFCRCSVCILFFPHYFSFQVIYLSKLKAMRRDQGSSR